MFRHAGSVVAQQIPEQFVHTVSDRRAPVAGSILTVIIPEGMAQPFCGTPLSAVPMKLIQIAVPIARPFRRVQRARLIVAHPGDRYQVGVVAGEPGVAGVVGGASLAGDVAAASWPARAAVP